MVVSSPVVLSLLLLASLTALLVVAPRLSPPPQPAVAEEAPPTGAAAGGARGGADGAAGVWGAGAGEEADDLRLLRRAALEAAAAEAAGPPKVAFLFLTNSDLTFAPLWERFFAGNEARLTVYVHADPAARLRLPAARSFRGRFHCVPLHSFQRLYAALFPPPAPGARRGLQPRRLPSYIEVLTGEAQMPARYAARGEGAMLPEVPYDRFRIGSQFFTLARRHAVLVVRERRLWRKFRVPCLPEMAQDSWVVCSKSQVSAYTT
ncbi:hypothetical protein C2845_PM03G20220 [Panicum miliaceum]|uniref:Uncharacterized protein n=1 Tax=Panicum miliaceum TaxID=4540 RepID=A0A3L6T7S1_PANMI|nr:hypothetical protein C2845_PM03G20220 [Panicum miliaceum]